MRLKAAGKGGNSADGQSPSPERDNKSPKRSPTMQRKLSASPNNDVKEN